LYNCIHLLKMTLFWNVLPWSLVENNRRFKGARCLLHQRELSFIQYSDELRMWHVCWHVIFYMVTHHKHTSVICNKHYFCVVTKNKTMRINMEVICGIFNVARVCTSLKQTTYKIGSSNFVVVHLYFSQIEKNVWKESRRRKFFPKIFDSSRYNMVDSKLLFLLLLFRCGENASLWNCGR
jgi:hypothetical protein